jgi:acetate kinase
LKIDPEYIDFLAKQEKLFDVDQEQVAEMMKESGLTAVQDKSTPLLDFIREKGRKKLEKIKSRKILKLKDPAVIGKFHNESSVSLYFWILSNIR